MRTLLVTSLVLGLSASAIAPAFADDRMPHCTVAAVNRTDTDLYVPGVFSNGPRWAEYNCRVESQPIARRWAEEHGECPAGKMAFKYTLLLGKRGYEKKMELTALCKKR